MLTDHGLFLTLDGPPGSGRTTTAAHLAAALAVPEYGREILIVTPPPITGRLSDANRVWLAGYVEACAALARETVAPALARGALVIADGWITSAFLRARAGTNVATHAIVRLWALGTREVCPDVEFLLTRSDDAIGKRVAEETAHWKNVVCSMVRAHHPPAPLMPRSERRLFGLSMDATREAMVARLHAIDKARASEVPEGQEAWSVVVTEGRDARNDGHARALLGEWITKGGGTMGLVDLAARWDVLTDATREALVAMIPENPAPLRAVQAALDVEGHRSASLEARIPVAEEGERRWKAAEEARIAAEKESADAARLAAETASNDPAPALDAN